MCTQLVDPHYNRDRSHIVYSAGAQEATRRHKVRRTYKQFSSNLHLQVVFSWGLLSVSLRIFHTAVSQSELHRSHVPGLFVRGIIPYQKKTYTTHTHDTSMIIFTRYLNTK